MEKLVLVTQAKYQRLLGAQSTKTMLKRKILPKPPPGNLMSKKGGLFYATLCG